MTIRWVSFKMATGDVVADIASMSTPQGPLRRSIGQYDTVQCSLYLDGAPANWVAGTAPGVVGLASYDDAEAFPQKIQWGGFVVTRQRSLTSGTADLTLATFDAYFDRRIVGDYAPTQVGQNDIAKALVYGYAGSAGRYPGVPFEYVCEDGVGVPGKLRDRKYLDADNTTVYRRLQQLAGVRGGVEWTVDLGWDSTGTKIYPTFRYGSRIGNPVPAGQRPLGVFETGSITDASLSESYADGDGANVVLAYSSGQATVSPTSGPVFAPFSQRPAFEYRYQPSSSITDISLLKDYARAAARFLSEGQSALSLDCAITDTTRYGSTWKLGDDVEAILDLSQQFPQGLDVIGRAVAYELDPASNTISPILAVGALPSDEELT
jgi:hypothetical protein